MAARTKRIALWISALLLPLHDTIRLAEDLAVLDLISGGRVSMVTGSHHMQAYWVPSNSGNGQLSLPFTYLFDDKRWVPRGPHLKARAFLRVLEAIARSVFLLQAAALAPTLPPPLSRGHMPRSRP